MAVAAPERLVDRYLTNGFALYFVVRCVDDDLLLENVRSLRTVMRRVRDVEQALERGLMRVVTPAT